VPPSAPGVGRDREADRQRAAIRITTDLEGGDDLLAPGKAVRLRLGCVLRTALGERIAGDSSADPLAVAGDAVGCIGGDEVVPGTARDGIPAPAGDVDPVGSCARGDAVGMRGAEQEVGAWSTVDAPCGGRGSQDKRHAARREQHAEFHRGPLPS
jgi:hypothetical protein